MHRDLPYSNLCPTRQTSSNVETNESLSASLLLSSSIIFLPKASSSHWSSRSSSSLMTQRCKPSRTMRNMKLSNEVHNSIAENL